MRKNCNVVAGQTWRSSDPRRLQLIKITEDSFSKADPEWVAVEVLYPRKRFCNFKMVPLKAFFMTGSKGLTRVS